MTDKVRLSPRRLICSQRCCQAGSGAKPENATRGIFLIARHKQQVEASSAPALLWYLPAPEPCRSGALQPVLVPVWFSPADPVPAGRSPSSGRWVGAGGSSLGALCTCVAFTRERCCRFPPLMRPNSLAQQVWGGLLEISLYVFLRLVRLLPLCSTGSSLLPLAPTPAAAPASPRFCLLCGIPGRTQAAGLKGGDAVALAGLLGQRGFGQRLVGKERGRRS